MDVVDTKLGSEGALKVGLEGGKLVLAITHAHASGEVSLVAKEDLKYFLEQLKPLIKGNVDDMIIDVIKGMIP